MPGVLEDRPGASLVFLGAYTHYDSLPHYPTMRNDWASGFTTARWANGKLQPLSVTSCHNPAFMKYHPRLNVLYVLTECIHTEGYITAFSVDAATGALHELGRLSMTGRSTCYISFDRDARHAVVTNYWDGRVNVVELDALTGRPLRVVQEHQQTRRETWRQVQDRADHMANRQDGPHAHCNVFHPTYRWLFVPDLGDNCIYQYGYSAGRITPQAYVQLPPGDGPRHLVFHPTLPVAYSGCELRSHVQVFAVDESDPELVKQRLAPVQHIPTLPEGGFDGINYVGEIKIDAAGRFLYVSNRGHDSIAVYAVDPTTGQLRTMGVCPTLGTCPRHFGLSPCGDFLLAANQDSDAVRVFRLDSATGLLTPTGEEHAFACPNFVLFARPHALPAKAPTRAAVTVQVHAAWPGEGEALGADEGAPSEEELMKARGVQAMPLSPIAVITSS